MNKIVELIINMEEFEFDDLGVEILSLVDKPAIEVNWMAFSEEFALRENPDCPDGFEHQMPDGTWMCGKEHEHAEFESFTDYPEGARNNAKRAIEYKEKNGSDCGTQVGWTRARQLADGKPISEETIARMASFERHRQHSDVPYTEGCGGIMWDAWGGSAGVNWAISKLKKIDNES